MPPHSVIDDPLGHTGKDHHRDSRKNRKPDRPSCQPRISTQITKNSKDRRHSNYSLARISKKCACIFLRCGLWRRNVPAIAGTFCRSTPFHLSPFTSRLSPLTSHL